MDRFPIPVCRFARANRVRRSRDQSAYGWDELAKQTFLGLIVHLRVCWPGVIVCFCLTPANVADLPAARDQLDGQHEAVLPDRNYWSPPQQQEWREQNLFLLAPHKSKTREPAPWPRSLVQKAGQ